MRLRALPAVKAAADLVAAGRTDEAIAYRNAAMLDLVKQPGFQFALQALNSVEHDAIQDLRHGKNVNSAFLTGIIHAAETIRNRIMSLLPEQVAVADAEPEEEFEEEFLGPSAFSIPPPSGA